MSERALRILEKAMIYGFTKDGRKRPGEIIEGLSAEDRKILSELTSDDTKNQRIDK